MVKIKDDLEDVKMRHNKDIDFRYKEYLREIDNIKKTQQPIINNVANLLEELNNYGRNNN